MAPPGPLPGTAPPGWPARPAGQSLAGLATALTVLLWIEVALGIACAGALINRISVAGDLLHGDFLGFLERVRSADNAVGAAYSCFVLVGLAIAVLLIIWMWRVAKNAELTGCTQPRFSPGWTIGGWFIPLANLVIPVLIVQDLWRASEPGAPQGDPTWRRRSGSALVGWWWATHVASYLLVLRGSGSNLEELRTADTVACLGAVTATAAAILLVQVVRRITSRQQLALGRA